MQPDDTVRVDVLIAARAPAPWLQETLTSLVDQTFTGWRLVLVMDGYDARIAAECAAIGHGYLPLEVPPGSGMVAALNHGLAQCRSEYIARIDADDVAMPERFATQVQFMDEHPEYVAVSTGYLLVDSHGTVLGRRVPRERDPIRMLRWFNPLAHPSMMIRREALVQSGGYDARARHLEDYQLWLRLASEGRFGIISEPLLMYRQHENQVTKRHGYSRDAREALLEARRALARSENKSELAARMRHAAWTAVNRVQGR